MLNTKLSTLLLGYILSITWILTFTNSFIMAQDSSAQCMTLSGSAACPDWDGSQILLASGYYSNQDEFDSFIQGQYDNNQTYIDKFKSSYGCSGYNGHGQRYHISVYCSMMVYASQDSCGGQTSNPTICKDTCYSARQALSNVFNNNEYCSVDSDVSTDQYSARTSSLNTYDTLCGTLQTSSKDDGTCFSGDLSFEAKTCGFFYESDAKSYCSSSSGKGDSCCKYVSTTNKTTIIIGAVVGVVALLLIILIVVFFWRRRNNKKTRNANSSRYLDESTIYNEASTMANPFRANDKFNDSDDWNKGRINPISTAFVGVNDFALKSPQGSVNSGVVSPRGVNQNSPLSTGGSQGRMSNIPYDVQSGGSSGSSRHSRNGPRSANSGHSSSSNNSVRSPNYNNMSTLVPNNNNSLMSPPASASDFHGTMMYSPSSSNRTQVMDESAIVNRSDYLPRSLTQPPSQPIKVWAKYSPKMDDEIILNAGDSVVVHIAYDDGWARGQNLTTGDEGAFPMAALVTPGQKRGTIVGSRHSSVYGM